MIVYATKLTFRKAVLGIVMVGALILGVTTLRGEQEVMQSVSTVGTSELGQTLKTTEQQVQLLRNLGWEVDDTPITETEVQIPEEFDETYTEYNELQKQQGLDLEKYKGKRAMLYVYSVKNDPSGSDTAAASMVIYNDKLIAADICVPEEEGLLRTITAIEE